MPGRSIKSQVQLLQRETTPGTAATNAMKKLTALRFRPSWEGEATPFMGGSSKVATSVDLGDEIGRWTVEGINDFNHLGLVAASRLSGSPTTTQPDATNAPTAYQHVFTLNPDSEDPLATYTLIWGDSTQAVQAVYAVFNSLGITIRRGQLEFRSALLSRAPTTGATIPGSGVTTMAPKAMPSTKWDVYADDTWAALGTTKLLAAYEGAIDLGDKYQPDAPINSTITSFESLLEAEDQNYGFDLRLGFDAAAIALMNTFQAGTLKFFRFAVEGPTIGGAVKYLCQLDFAAFVLSRGELSPAPNSPAVTVPFRLALAKDTNNNACRLTLVNEVASY